MRPRPPLRGVAVVAASLVVAALVVVGAQAFRPLVELDGVTVRRTREVKIKQGRLTGLVYVPSTPRGPPDAPGRPAAAGTALQPVDVFRGVPYAAPPVGDNRFMPPQRPPAWSAEVLRADKDPPPCPQRPPPPAALLRPSVARVARRLADAAEDCLRLNIYVPHQEGAGRYPVIVFFHGESLEWGAGSVLDACALASFGDVLVITFNFRLGVLGFLSPPDTQENNGNYGLWDAIAVLQWVQDNIERFRGDPANVTLLGHGTGAALAALLLLSPAAGSPPPAPYDAAHAHAHAHAQPTPTLFHRAALLSGTALADWAVVRQPEEATTATTQLAQVVNCALQPHHLLKCLRQRRLGDLVNATVHKQPFAPRWAPVVDGRVVVNLPDDLMRSYQDRFSRYPLLLGLTQIESLDLLPEELHPLVGRHRLLGRDSRDAMTDVLNKYLRYRFPSLHQTALGYTLETYLPSSSMLGANAYRDALLDILTDARVAAPVIRTADLRVGETAPGSSPGSSLSRALCFLYVFTHSSRYGDYNETGLGGSVSGEELPYVLGLPLDPASPSTPHPFTADEVLLAKAVVTYITNFAKSGNPNKPHRPSFPEHAWGGLATDVPWPLYDPRNQSYLRIGLPPHQAVRYRQQLVKFWTSVLPESLAGPPPFHHERPLPPPPPPLPIPDPVPPPASPPRRYDPFPMPPLRPPPPPPPPLKPTPPPSNDFPPAAGPSSPGTTVRGPLNLADSGSVALTIVIVVGVCFLLVNLCAFAGLYVQRDRLRSQEEAVRRRYEDLAMLGPPERCPLYDARPASPPGPLVHGPLAHGPVPVGPPAPAHPSHAVPPPAAATPASCDPRRAIRQVAQDDDYEAIRSGAGARTPDPRLLRQCSASTMDAHSKVREWIVRCSPRCVRRQPGPNPRHAASVDTSIDRLSECPGEEVATSTPTPTPAPAPTPAPPLQAPSKAPSQASHTPHAGTARSAPSAGSRSGAPRPRKVSVAVDATPAARCASLQRQFSCDESPASRSLDELVSSSHQEPCCVSTSSITLRRPSGPLPVSHAHSRSDPAPLSTFAPSPAPAMVNVTSRDSSEDPGRETGFQHPLDSIQRRNFPKVLPDLPDASDPEGKRLSLPEATGVGVGAQGAKVPPPPPPRVCSTLGRNASSAVHAGPRVVIKATPAATPAGAARRAPGARVTAAPCPVVTPTPTPNPTPTSSPVPPSPPAGSSPGSSATSSSDASGTGTVRRAAGWYGRYSRAVRSRSREGHREGPSEKPHAPP